MKICRKKKEKSAIRSDDKIGNMNTQIRSITTLLNTTEDRIAELELKVKNMENAIDQQEQYSRPQDMYNQIGRRHPKTGVEHIHLHLTNIMLISNEHCANLQSTYLLCVLIIISYFRGFNFCTTNLLFVIKKIAYVHFFDYYYTNVSILLFFARISLSY